MLNTLLMSFSDNLAVLVALLLFFIWFQSRRHKDNIELRELIANLGKDLRREASDSNKSLCQEIADGNKSLRQEIADCKKELRGEIGKVSDRVTQVETNLREEICEVKDELGKVSERVARIEGRLGLPPPCAGKKQPGTPPGGDAMPDPNPAADL